MQAAVNEDFDKVDKILAKTDGKIIRELDPQLCQHRSNQKCTNCLPLDPYDENYLREKDIKHLSFHAYVRKLTDLHGRGTRSNNVLENVDCKLKMNCEGHLPYPKGICTKCRPSTLTLNRQVFRHVDNIEFENGNIVSEFLDFWRHSLHQRIGFLIGRYEPFAEVPLGIKAVVCAIYEPPQNSTQDSVTLVDDPNEKKVDQLCGWLGLKRVGWIFTDLWSEDPKMGTVHNIRNEESFFLSAAECITAGHLQSKYRNYTEYCSDGYFGSKFLTVVASGNKDKQIDLHGYQVSNQCTAMVDADILCPTQTHPELAWIREKPLNEKHYITDVQYTEKDEYGAEVRRNGRPMPVEYLLVDVPCGVRKEPSNTFSPLLAISIENRSNIGQTQELNDLAKQLDSLTLPMEFIKMAANFHFLLFLYTNHLVEFHEEELKALAHAVRNNDEQAVALWAEQNPTWGTFSILLREISAI